jgi:hypothetical protein
MAHKIQIKRGNKADIPVLNDGEMGLCIDTQEVFVGCNGTNIPVNTRNGGDADTVGGFTVGVSVPAGAKFTDTVTTVNGKTGAIAKADIVALGIPAQDTVYTHPANHPASIITQDSNNRFVTDVEKNNWNSKADVSDIPTSLSQLTNDSGFITINQVPQSIEVVQNTPTTTKSGQIIFLEVL